MRRIALAALVAVVGALDAHAGATARELQEAVKHQERGAHALRDGKLDKAEKHFVRSLDKVPSFPGSHLGMGHIAMQRRDFEAARTSFVSARDGYATLGALLIEFEGKRYMEAQRELVDEREILKELRTRPLTSGESESQREANIARTEARVQRLMAIEPPNPHRIDEPPGEIYFYLGNALFNLRRIPEALDAWRECAERSPDFAMVHNNLAAVYMQLGSLTEARQHLTEAERLGFAVHEQFKKDLERRLAVAYAGSESDPTADGTE